MAETEPGGGTAPGGALPDPVLVARPIAPGRQAEASEIYRRAQSAYDQGRFEEAARLSSRIVEEFPASAVSGRALLMNARAASQSGDGTLADASAERFIGLVPPEDPRIPGLRILQARALAGRDEARVDRLLRIPPVSPDSVRQAAIAMARESVVELELDAVTELLTRVADPGPVHSIVEARRAALLLISGDREAAAEVARRALASGASGPDSVLAAEVRAGRFPDGYLTVRSVTLGAVLPLEGAPALAAFARSLLEGVEVAVATALGPGFDVTLRVVDDGGDLNRTGEAVAALEREGVAGVVGFLEEYTLNAAAEAREGSVPLVSPTARMGRSFGDGVYSLEGVDREGIRQLARYGATRAYQRVAIIQSTSPLSSAAGDVFEEESARFGGLTVGRYTYPEGATFFEDQIRAARDALRRSEIGALGLTENDTLRVEELEPVALFVPVPPEDVELLAPQIIHFGLDTLGIEVLGTTGWTDPETLARVDPRHTNGVVATAPVGAGLDTERYATFKAAYENHFQRSLVSSIPAMGYDAALLILEAIAAGGASSGPRFLTALESLDQVEGATGVYSVEDGRVVRRTHAVRIRDRTLTPIPTG